ncbi:hypothetical protein LB823_01985 [Tsukamurella sp. M9C]|uniref:hypothetical protein n=1 Tax=Tsukamurella sp. M9C TaxID=2877520 RepID=UPI001CCB4097|nr:hypothetical protein [Tsukamurella sp. M9C]MCA0154961.1 hypothetical protein [Tsukamurella sp. M9C]
MGVFDRADEGSEEARAYRAELAAENDRLAVKVLPVLLVMMGIVATWGAITLGADVARGSGGAVRCEGRSMGPADTCWMVLSEAGSAFDLYAPAGAPASRFEAQRAARQRGISADPSPYDYAGTRMVRKQEHSNDVVGTVLCAVFGATAFIAAYYIRRGARVEPRNAEPATQPGPQT